jgi:extracellular factor (EF) 3-hydroxypalmitic acid methyl ester biosynthesis protein
LNDRTSELTPADDGAPSSRGVLGEAGPHSATRPLPASSRPPPPDDARSTSEPPPPPAYGEVADYADRDGGQGRDVFFRPDRYQRADLGPIGVAVEIDIGERRYSCELFDVSQNGVAFAWPAEISVEMGASLECVTIRFDDHEAYRGQARVSSIRRQQERTIVGVSFVDTLMNIDDVLHLRDVKAWTGSASSKGIELARAPWRVQGQDRFKSLVAEFRLMLEDARASLTELEASLPWDLLHGEHRSPAREALVERLRREFVGDMLHYSDEIDAALRVSSRDEREALREFSTRYLHDLLMQSPSMYRARFKPLGYPGDYEVMNDIYVNHLRGTNLFAKALNLGFVSTAAARAVRARKDLIKAQLSAQLDAGESSRPLRVLSIAAGPAQEIYEFLAERATMPRPLEVVLFDQDKRALSYSYGRLKRIVSAKWKKEVTLVHLHDSIKRVLRGNPVFSGQGQFDFVYSCGLLDYVQLLTAVSLCRGLFGLVAPGGKLLVGNMVPASPSRWFMELHLDWFLVYREREEILEIGRAAAGTAELELLEEATGLNPFMALTRPAL